MSGVEGEESRLQMFCLCELPFVSSIRPYMALLHHIPYITLCSPLCGRTKGTDRAIYAIHCQGHRKQNVSGTVLRDACVAFAYTVPFDPARKNGKTGWVRD